MTELVVVSEVDGSAEAVGAAVFDDLSTTSKAVSIDREYARRRRFEGRRGTSLELPGAESSLVVLVGAGPRQGPSRDERAETIRRAGAAFARATLGLGKVAFDLAGTYDTAAAPGALTAEDAAQAFGEGFLLAAHRFTRHKSWQRDEAPPREPPAVVSVVSADPDETRIGLERGTVIAKAVAFARDIGDEPAAYMTPRRLAEIAAEVAGTGRLELVVFDEEAIARERLGGLAGVAQGSSEPARMILLRYRPEGAAEPAKKVVLVGKGITFDSGGLTLKNYDGMKTMKTDMCGAAAVIATLGACRALGVPIAVTGIVPATENMPGPGAVKPGDVLTIRNGKTIEVLNTDAEGRLVLADGLSLAQEEQPDAIVDLATLTGACIVALGASIAGTMGNNGELMSLVRTASERAGEPTWELPLPDAIVDLATLTGACIVALGASIAGTMGNDSKLMSLVRGASERAGEPTWELPLPDEYRSQIDSEVADMKNVGTHGQGSALAAGIILSEFVGGVPWVHMDIAGPAQSDEDKGYFHKGTTGFGVRTMLELLSAFGDNPSR